MKRAFKVILLLLALGQTIAWTFFTAAVWRWGLSGGGAGASAGGQGSELSAIIGFLLVAVIWLVPISPYLCIAAWSLDMLAEKSVGVAYVVSLVVLAITTIIMLLSLQMRLEIAALGNIILGILWSLTGRKIVRDSDNSTV